MGRGEEGGSGTRGETLALPPRAPSKRRSFTGRTYGTGRASQVLPGCPISPLEQRVCNLVSRAWGTARPWGVFPGRVSASRPPRHVRAGAGAASNSHREQGWGVSIPTYPIFQPFPLLPLHNLPFSCSPGAAAGTEAPGGCRRASLTPQWWWVNSASQGAVFGMAPCKGGKV